MAEAEAAFNYVAINASGRRVRGQVSAASETRAYASLKRDGLTPVRIAPCRSIKIAPVRSRGAIKDTELEALLGDLAALLRAGADIRSALAILGRRNQKSSLRAACERLSVAIGGGEGSEAAFARLLGRRHEVIPALLAAGEAGGDLALGLERGGQMLAARRVIRGQLLSALSYPAFVLVSTLAAMGLILFAVVPSFEPLVEDAGGKAPPTLATLLAMSEALRTNILPLAGGVAAVTLALAIAGRAGLLTRPLQRLALDGPAGTTVSGLVFGGFAQSLGAMLHAGAPMGDALRLAIRTATWSEARARLAPVLAMVRQGEMLSLALDQVKGFPPAVARLAAVGEATGALGPMLARGGAFEETAALARIEAAAKLLGPAFIVLLGGMIGVLMASLLSGITGLGNAALG